MKKSGGFGFMVPNVSSFHLTILLNAADVAFAISVVIIASVATRALFSKHLNLHMSIQAVNTFFRQ